MCTSFAGILAATGHGVWPFPDAFILFTTATRGGDKIAVRAPAPELVWAPNVAQQTAPALGEAGADG
jgi:hypothetical protein